LKKIVWEEELSVGMQSIDDDHKELLSIINDLFEAIEDIHDKDLLRRCFDRLEEYTHYHFDHEETFMDEHCSSFELREQIEKHKKQHQYFKDQLPKLREKLLHASTKSVAYEVAEFLLQWLLDHIIDEDLKLAQCIEPKHTKKPSFIERIGDTLRRKTSLYQRLWIILALPLFFFIMQTLFISYNGYKKYTQLQDVEHITQAVISINNVITQLQKERGLSSAYISSKYRYFEKELHLQRERTDHTFQRSISFHKVLIPHINIKKGLSALEKLEKTRLAIDKHLLTKSESLSYYTNFIKTLISLIKDISYLPVNTIDRNTYGPILVLLHLNEVNGLIRQEGVSCITSDQNSCEHLKELYHKKKDYLTALHILATPDIQRTIDQVETSENAKKIHRLQKRLLHGTLHGSQIAKEWFSVTTQRIETYKQLIEKSLQKIGHDAYLQKEHFATLISIIWTIFAVIILFIGISIYLLKESILRPLKVLTDALHKLSSGDRSIYFSSLNQKDAIGKMERAYNHLRRSLIKADYTNLLMELQERKTEKYAKLSEEDPLTGIANRRAFMQRLRYEIEFAKKHQTPLTLLVLDLDHFKRINDTYGHATGDLLLQRFVQHTKTLIRNSDIFARIGGEEFALLLPNTGMEGARKLSEKIIKEISSLELDDLAPGLQMTVSIGISTFEKGLEPKQFIAKADKNLYTAKHRGRNQVCC